MEKIGSCKFDSDLSFTQLSSDSNGKQADLSDRKRFAEELFIKSTAQIPALLQDHTVCSLVSLVKNSERPNKNWWKCSVS